MTAPEQARAIKDYMDFRARREEMDHDLTLDWYQQVIAQGIVKFFGVMLGPDGVIFDEQAPARFREWRESSGQAR
jgi:hypothetical protein